MMMRHVTTLLEGATRCLRAVLAGQQIERFLAAPGVGGFVDSGPKTPMPSASNRPTPVWTLADFVDFRRPGRGQPDGRSSTHHALADKPGLGLLEGGEAPGEL